MKGQLFSREDLYIDGEVEGSIEMQESKLTVGPNGRVQAGIKAREIVALGTIHGNVEVGDKIDIRKDAKLVGDIRTVRIVIEDGAYFKGSIDIAKPEAVMYEPMPDGTMKLVAVEYIGFKGPAALEGQLFNFNSAPNRYGLDPFYELHVWAWKANPTGHFADNNPDVTCNAAK